MRNCCVGLCLFREPLRVIGRHKRRSGCFDRGDFVSVSQVGHTQPPPPTQMRALFHVFACAGSIATRLFFGKTVTVRDPRYFWRLLSAVCVHFFCTQATSTLVLRVLLRISANLKLRKQILPLNDLQSRSGVFSIQDLVRFHFLRLNVRGIRWNGK